MALVVAPFVALFAAVFSAPFRAVLPMLLARPGVCLAMPPIVRHVDVVVRAVLNEIHRTIAGTLAAAILGPATLVGPGENSRSRACHAADAGHRGKSGLSLPASGVAKRPGGHHNSLQFQAPADGGHVME